MIISEAINWEEIPDEDVEDIIALKTWIQLTTSNLSAPCFKLSPGVDGAGPAEHCEGATST